jgi:hypothetical protein
MQLSRHSVGVGLRRCDSIALLGFSVGVGLRLCLGIALFRFSVGVGHGIGLQALLHVNMSKLQSVLASAERYERARWHLLSRLPHWRWTQTRPASMLTCEYLKTDCNQC